MIQILAASVGVVRMRTFVLKSRNLVILHSSEKENGSLHGIIVDCYSTYSVICEQVFMKS